MYGFYVKVINFKFGTEKTSSNISENGSIFCYLLYVQSDEQEYKTNIHEVSHQLELSGYIKNWTIWEPK